MLLLGQRFEEAGVHAPLSLPLLPVGYVKDKVWGMTELQVRRGKVCQSSQ